ncbi:MAG: HDIG domain-containing protein [Bdellovibrionales bacterium]|nr:HDIG domain-containing protein [Bdellovibrionales bacterium]
MLPILISLGAGFGMGSSVSLLISYLLRRQKINQTKQSARRLVQEAQDKEEQNQEQVLNKVEEYRLSLIQKHESYMEELSLISQQCEIEIEQLTQQKEEKLSKLEKEKKINTREIDNFLSLNKEKEKALKKTKNRLQEIREQIVQVLKSKFNISVAELREEIQKEKIDTIKTQMLQKIKEKEEYLKHNVNQQAHFILELVLSRFQHPYCPERGIKNVSWSNRDAMESLLGPHFSKMKILEKECGVDMKVSDKEASISILGIDPVRRELGRASLQKMVKRRRIKESDIKSLVQETKKELFRRIKSDGQRICRELSLKGMKTEIKNMMGALRYRYSFAQNQHFHCQEVGWLCGLLNAELYRTGIEIASFKVSLPLGEKKRWPENSNRTGIAEPVLLARRAGMLHDIGKAMDHSKEGGHAVIGADFIKKHGEDASIVYAVKAHHHDVTPEKPLDFLVIAADALSGARPGARRSTVDSYNQKVLTLEKIGRSFKGVKDTYIMSAGREIRVIVDSQKINDVKALELSKKIAGKIEEECSYPGLIKVTVVRQVTKSVNIGKHQSQV